MTKARGELMELKEWFAMRKKQKEDLVLARSSIPAGPIQRIKTAWTSCPGCQSALYTRDLLNQAKVCGKCSYHFTQDDLRDLVEET
jgi:acetyl-CoA carboxylase beta subunit